MAQGRAQQELAGPRPFERRDDLQARRRRPQGHRRRSRRRDRSASRLGRPARRRAREDPLCSREDPPGAQPRIRDPRDDRQRQADPRDARRGPATRLSPFLLSRGLDRQARVRAARPQGTPPRRLRAGDPVELPAAHGGVEARPRARCRQRRRAQAGRDPRLSAPCASSRSSSRPASRLASSTS
jgi:hypothetical protein